MSRKHDKWRPKSHLLTGSSARQKRHRKRCRRLLEKRTRRDGKRQAQFSAW